MMQHAKMKGMMKLRHGIAVSVIARLQAGQQGFKY